MLKHIQNKNYGNNIRAIRNIVQTLVEKHRSSVYSLLAIVPKSPKDNIRGQNHVLSSPKNPVFKTNVLLEPTCKKC